MGLGEAVACYGLGGLLLWRLDKSNALTALFAEPMNEKALREGGLFAANAALRT
ncbi:MAG: hypothetical protein ACLUS6_17005 [Dysosmobacter sp.]